ncbi:NAD(P)H-dependent glycerol-3-phosphate dehydrogenase [Campylobacter sp. RM12327]|uniref:NAD(P)H-dependent glycerol-3-phosphate dehydrogenase n=1 Tax=Campylobacter sputorum TaxID=206 RepID=UPI000B7714BF|nr:MULTISPECIES: NAD(P)H-dependent glycerol-3-phosphate dehydrogenase [Campylobacter]ASM39310.1 glycerol 3-phosphate dehydrogenase [Campylobacter sputorum]MBE7358477.1 NAD(P)H-dependent glycerol-3-phosphate dehydrogenase [Campylobacter sp. RM11302]MBF6669348.1 NAD(P)H-dependent glycerol-3-phosphate dehydrogenase [Campylobacter sp. RM12327]MBF6674616.1 NAD(P)H-dependent glycerol-3-phosphate dehydrogenase [Campylobacter sp. RM13538]MBF6676123.1 NAD(P)H-dependent glycerol-3-phosphate dehydrogenas
MKIAVIGAGKWGSALFNALSKKNDCVITSRSARDISNFVSIDEALNAEILVFALSSQHTREFLQTHFVNKNQKILVASKGIEAGSGMFLNEIFENFMDAKNLAYLSGPSFATEVLAELPCALVISSQNLSLCNKLGELFPSKYMKIYSSNDVVGAEICGAYKNVLAIASGVCDGLKLGNNARASLISRGLIEMSRFGKFFGAKDETFMGLSGAGDLFLTASSVLSRNYRVGMGLACKKDIKTILNEINEVAEGVETAKAIQNIAQKYCIYTPIVNEVVSMINGKSPTECLCDLLRKK